VVGQMVVNRDVCDRPGRLREHRQEQSKGHRGPTRVRHRGPG
jgi:hypothetical protein